MNEDFPQDIQKRRSQLYPAYKLAIEKKHKARMLVDKLIVDSMVYTVDCFHKLPSDIHPKQLAERSTTDAVFFHGKYSSFSNFHPSEFIPEGQKFNSVEQFYQFKRVSSTGNQSIASEIMDSIDPAEQYQLSKRIIPDSKKWSDKIANQFMELAVNAKFQQNDLLRSELLSTSDKLIVECNPHDRIWSCGLKINSPDVEEPDKWLGKNQLGKILIKVRESLS
jgi:ribA/ribD-fused uncharacterized protein